MRPHRRHVLAGLGAASFSGLAPARAQTWPSQIIRLVVPFTPGGSTDVLARLIATKLEQVIPGRGFVIENRPGAGGMTAAGQVAKADPDGHTLMMGHIGTLAFAPSLYPNVPYDPVRDFRPIALVAMVPNILAINPQLPAKTLGEFIAHARAHPGKLNYSS
ncbi:MAG: tripartite tricarboxylate transporter substrate binding protein, partial [Beijerinckiaceae bacterium]|nr:tripartite tricarboxylate transporter substrate binding protein [Beijerinckiaceae bacterium]